MALAVILTAVGRSAYTAVTVARASDLEARYESQSETMQNLARMEEMVAALKQRRQRLSDAAGGAPAHCLLAELTALMPDTMQLIELSLDRSPAELKKQETAVATPCPAGAPEEDGVLKLRGWAASDTEVGGLMTRLAHSPVCRQVSLRYTKPVVVHDRQAREFEMICRLRRFE